MVVPFRAATSWLSTIRLLHPGLRQRSLRSHRLALGFGRNVPSGLAIAEGKCSLRSQSVSHATVTIDPRRRRTTLNRRATRTMQGNADGKPARVTRDATKRRSLAKSQNVRFSTQTRPDTRRSRPRRPARRVDEALWRSRKTCLALPATGAHLVTPANRGSDVSRAVVISDVP